MNNLENKEMNLDTIKQQVVNNKIQYQIKHSWNKKFKSYKALNRLLISSYMNEKINILYFFLNFVVFILFGVVYLAVNKNENGFINANSFKTTLIGLIAMQVISTGAYQLPTTVFEIKNSILIKRINSTPITTKMFVFTVYVLFFVLSIIFSLFMFLIVFLMFGFWDYQFENSNQIIKGYQLLFSNGSYFDINNNLINYGVNWLTTSISLIYMIILSIAIGFFTVSISKSPTQLALSENLIHYTSMLLSGMLFSLDYIKKIDVLNYISFATPYRYTQNLLLDGWNNINLWNIENIVSCIIPVLLIIISFIVTFKKLKINNR